MPGGLPEDDLPPRSGDFDQLEQEFEQQLETSMDEFNSELYSHLSKAARPDGFVSS